MLLRRCFHLAELEELFHDDERLTATASKKILLARSRDVPWDVLARKVEMLERACASFDEETIKRVLGDLVPEYRSGSPDAGSNVVPISPATQR